MMAVVEILPGIHSLPTGRGDFMGLYAPNAFLLTGEKAILIDSGYGVEASIKAKLDYLKGYALTHILITHAHKDHIGGALAIKKATGAQILIHPLGAPKVEGVDGVIEDGQRLKLGERLIEVIHTPGHSPGHVCFWLPETEVLFSGDHVLGLGTTAISPLDGDMGQYMASLEKLLNFPIKLICPGHGPVVRNAISKIKELLQHRREREAQVIACLRQGISNPSGMVKEIYPELDPRLFDEAGGQIKCHLIKLEREGRVGKRNGDYCLT